MYTSIYTYGQIDRQIDRQTDRQIDRQIFERLSNHSSNEKKKIKNQQFTIYSKIPSIHVSELVSKPPGTVNQEYDGKMGLTIWFDPPYNRSAISQISQSFLHLIDTYYRKTTSLRRYLRRSKFRRVIFACRKLNQNQTNYRKLKMCASREKNLICSFKG